jgi:hypothetical protein
MKVDLKNMMRIRNTCSLVFLVTGTSLAIVNYLDHLSIKELIRNDKFGLTSALYDHGLDNLLRYAIIATGLVLLTLLGRKRRSAFLILAGAFVLILTVLQCFVVVRVELNSHLTNDLWSWSRLVATILLAVSGITLGAGNLIASIRHSAPD